MLYSDVLAVGFVPAGWGYCRSHVGFQSHISSLFSSNEGAVWPCSEFLRVNDSTTSATSGTCTVTATAVDGGMYRESSGKVISSSNSCLC